jgi:hypothetical protein
MKTFITIGLILIYNYSFGQQIYQGAFATRGRVLNYAKTAKDSENKSLKTDFFKKDSIQKPVQFSVGQGGFNGQVYSELLADKVGSGKLSLGGVITDAKNDSSRNINNFMAGGGNLVINYALPMFWNDTKIVKAAVFFCPRSGLNFPKLKENQRLENWNLDIGFETQIEIVGENKNIGLVIKNRTAICGGSKDFMSSFRADEKKTFGYLQFSGGIIIKKSLLVNLNFKPLIGGKISEAFTKTNYSSIGLQTYF